MAWWVGGGGLGEMLVGLVVIGRKCRYSGIEYWYGGGAMVVGIEELESMRLVTTGRGRSKKLL